MAKKLRVIVDSRHHPLFNTAMDSCLLRCLNRSQLPVLRIYGWQCPSLSLGSRQLLMRAKALLGNMNIPYYFERVSGGKCYYHFDEIMLCFISTIPAEVKSGTTIDKRILFFQKAVKNTLNKMGIYATVPSPDFFQSEKASFLFQQSPYDLYDDRQKPLAVFAQKTGRTRMLIHCAVMSQRLSQYIFLLKKEREEFIDEFYTILAQNMIELYNLPALKVWNYSEKMSDKAWQEAGKFLLSR